MVPDTSELKQRWGVTPEELRERERMHPDSDPEKNERRCGYCGNRVTKTKSGAEVGHACGRKKPMCPQHPDNDPEAAGKALEVDIRKEPVPQYRGERLGKVETEQADLGGWA